MHASNTRTRLWRQAVLAAALCAGLSCIVVRANDDLDHLGAVQECQASSGTSVGIASPQHFARKAAMGGLLEVKLGRLATERAQNSAVRQFAERMVKDHANVNQQLMSLAQTKGITLPTSDELNPEGKSTIVRKAEAAVNKDVRTIERFEKLSGPEFDRQYMATMVKDHQKDVREFEDAATNLSDPDLRNFAKQNLPTLREHLSMAERIASQLGVANIS